MKKFLLTILIFSSYFLFHGVTPAEQLCNPDFNTIITGVPYCPQTVESIKTIPPDQINNAVTITPPDKIQTPIITEQRYTRTPIAPYNPPIIQPYPPAPLYNNAPYNTPPDIYNQQYNNNLPPYNQNYLPPPAVNNYSVPGYQANPMPNSFNSQNYYQNIPNAPGDDLPMVIPGTPTMPLLEKILPPLIP